ncbi:MAG: hypothetical protein HOL08_04245 [Opitutae bacterium]|nr:hypothetical protein [Opitutae bacterium]
MKRHGGVLPAHIIHQEQYNVRWLGRSECMIAKQQRKDAQSSFKLNRIHVGFLPDGFTA